MKKILIILMGILLFIGYTIVFAENKNIEAKYDNIISKIVVLVKDNSFIDFKEFILKIETLKEKATSKKKEVFGILISRLKSTIISPNETQCAIVKNIFSKKYYGDRIQICGEKYYTWQNGIEGGGIGTYFNTNGNEIGSKIINGIMGGIPGQVNITGTTFETNNCKIADIKSCGIINLNEIIGDKNSEYRKNCKQAIKKLKFPTFPESNFNETTPQSEIDENKKIRDQAYRKRKFYYICTDYKTVNFIHFNGSFKTYDPGNFSSEEEIFKKFDSISVYNIKGDLVGEVNKSNIELITNGDQLHKVHLHGENITKDFISCQESNLPEDCLQ